MHVPTVSVVIPCFNQGHFLAEAIDSVFAQTLPPSELLIVDDGSTDDTAAVARRYSSARYLAQPNLGLARARNRGLRAARSEFLVFLDADDRLRPGALDAGVEGTRSAPGGGVSPMAAASASTSTGGRCRRERRSRSALTHTRRCSVTIPSGRRPWRCSEGTRLTTFFGSSPGLTRRPTMSSISGSHAVERWSSTRPWWQNTASTAAACRPTQR